MVEADVSASIVQLSAADQAALAALLAKLPDQSGGKVPVVQTPAADIPDARYIGDIKFGEELPAGEAHIGAMGGHTVRK